MATVEDIVTRAFRKVGISGVGDDLEAAEVTEGVDALVDMLNAWSLSGVELGEVTLTADQAFPLGSQYVEGTVYMLASRLSPNFEIPQMFDADDFFRRIQADHIHIRDVEVPSALASIGKARHRRAIR